MRDCTLRTLDGNTVTVSRDAVTQLDNALSGNVVTPDHPEYKEIRSVWNAMIDRRPGLIVRCADAQDVVSAVDFAREHRLLVAVRGAGHNIAGNAVCDGGLMIDLIGMKKIDVDPKRRTARVEPGVTLGELDRATQPHGLAVPSGINSTTGIAGLTLGGGFGWLSRKYGATVDCLDSVEMVMADGNIVPASKDENADLFWGVRGGGGNFGIVTSFNFRMREVGPEVLAGLIVHPGDAAVELLRGYREVADQAPDDLTIWAILRQAPPLPFLPKEVHGTPVVVFAVFWFGDAAAGEEALAPLRALGKPYADVVGVQPFADWQAAFDPLLTEGARNYWKSHDFLDLSDGLIDTIVADLTELPTPETEIFIAQMGGATARVPSDSTAYRHRDARYVMNVHGRWRDPSDDARCVDWCRHFFEQTKPYATGGVYVNFMTDDEQGRVRDAYGANYDRLLKLKTMYDPLNLFRVNQNVRPAEEAAG
jgi:FAD/FMN-containing dehydrogenase